MKVLVAVKRVVDYNVNVRAKSDGTGLHLHQVVEFVNRLDGSRSLQAVLDDFLASRNRLPADGVALIKA